MAAPDTDQVAIAGRIRRITHEIGELQRELAELQSLLLATSQPARTGSGWTPNPEPQPWLVRSA